MRHRPVFQEVTGEVRQQILTPNSDLSLFIKGRNGRSGSC